MHCTLENCKDSPELVHNQWQILLTMDIVKYIVPLYKAQYMREGRGGSVPPIDHLQPRVKKPLLDIIIITVIPTILFNIIGIGNIIIIVIPFTIYFVINYFILLLS